MMVAGAQADLLRTCSPSSLAALFFLLAASFALLAMLSLVQRPSQTARKPHLIHRKEGGCGRSQEFHQKERVRMQGGGMVGN